MIGKNIKRVRKHRGITQWELAQATRVRPGTIYLIERESVKCPEELLAAIAKALDVSEDDLRR